MTSTQRVWLTPQAHRRLSDELAALLAPRPVRAADEAADQDDATIRRQTRIREILDLLDDAVVGEDAPDDGVAEAGMVLTVRYDDTDEAETFLLGVRDAEHSDIEVYSTRSPLGTALTGARQGEQRTFRVPNGSTRRVTLLKAVPYGQHRLEYTP
ncbi:MAG: transcription elongation factor GreAB [Actinophytocola sp.]|uniref:GreA/GreB family elongation factor n=1 Tax=Actinophytocola sp. TaxID=1872138 RepID=UPI001328F8FD|nr:GreA/GreB family elongation factor [Actinophytocola sp.]MPZ85320.1 transcription elongation factor GreAB [Actinophytocola sp.]